MAVDERIHLPDTPLSLKDLAILMEAYKNNVELSTMLHEQQKQLLIQQDDLLEKMKSLCGILTVSNEKILGMFSDIAKEQRDHDKNVVTTNSAITSLISDRMGSVKNMIYIMYFVQGTIILGLLGLIFK